MKSQDVVVLFKLLSLRQWENSTISRFRTVEGWEGWDGDVEGGGRDSFMSDFEELPSQEFAQFYTARGLSAGLGISKSEVNASIKRSIGVGLAIHDRRTGWPRVNTKSLLDFIVYGLKYVFPAETRGVVRGIPTSFSAPVLSERLMSAGEYIYVWEDARGKNMGQSLSPLYKSVGYAVRRDPRLYEFLALVDAVRVGNQRERAVAASLLEKNMRGGVSE